ncbi:MAG: ElyC/SanA/YdcF family protein [bacterium]
MITHGLVHAYGRLPNGWVDPQADDRCRLAANLYAQGKAQKLYVTVATIYHQRFVGEIMHARLGMLGVPREDIIFEPLGHNTAGEIDGFIRLVGAGRLANEGVVSITTWYHATRVGLLWYTRGHCAQIAESPFGARLTDLLLEPAKLVLTFVAPRGISRADFKPPRS